MESAAIGAAAAKPSAAATGTLRAAPPAFGASAAFGTRADVGRWRALALRRRASRWGEARTELLDLLGRGPRRLERLGEVEAPAQRLSPRLVIIDWAEIDADQIAAATDLLAGQANEGRALVLLRGLQFPARCSTAAARDLYRTPEQDTYA